MRIVLLSLCVIGLTGLAENPRVDLAPSAEIVLPDAPTRVGLVYTFREGTTLEGFGTKPPSATKDGDGKPWTPEITVKGGKSAFYSIGVGKGE